MKRPFAGSPILLLTAVLAHPLFGDGPAPPPASPELDEARRAGWVLVAPVVEILKAGDPKAFPGTQAWLKDFDQAAKGVDPKKPPAKWAPYDVDVLTTRNPHFWQAVYEIAPGDPGLAVLHAGLLLNAGEASRASYLAVVAKQRPGIPKEFLQGFDLVLAEADKAGDTSKRLVAEGIKLHDRADYAGAVKKYKEALAAWPQNGWAHFETGLTLYHQQFVAAGQKAPEPNSVVINGGTKQSAEVKAAYAKARWHEPFQFRAYQGDDPEVIQGCLALVKKGIPAMQKVVKKGNDPVDDDVLEDLAAACQAANYHELALAARQVLVARRGRFIPADHPFIAASLRKLAPGKETEEVLKRLSGGKLKLRQLVVPED